MKRTPLFATHQKLGAKLIEFGGWEMPVYYSSIIEEHHAVRQAAGIFDISHMGEITCRGPGALEFLNGVLTNDLRKIGPGQGQYTLLCNETGGVVDDLYAYCVGNEDYLLIVNASRIADDAAWLEARLASHPPPAPAKLTNQSDEMGAVAVQGPKVAAFIDACFPTAPRAPSTLRKNEVIQVPAKGYTLMVSRTGYTGEDGFEVVAPSGEMEGLWNNIFDKGRAHALKPAGLGARDTLRTESCYPLYGHELNEVHTPLQAGLGYFVALEKNDFVGRAVLAREKAEGVKTKLAAFKMVGASPPPRPNYQVWCGRTQSTRIGEVTSGTQSPTLNAGIGLAYVPAEFAMPGTPLGIEIRGRQYAAIVVPKPFYRCG